MDAQKKSLIGAITLVALVLVVGVFAAVALGATGHSKNTTTTSAKTTTPSSNEDPAHETGESAAREADENSGKVGYGHGHDGAFKPNESAAHEAGESAAREAQEDAGHVPTQP